MKTTVRILCVCILVCSSVSIIAQKNDIEAIKTLIEKETTAFFEIDYDTWASKWVQAPYAFWSFAKQLKSTHFRVGKNWEGSKILRNSSLQNKIEGMDGFSLGKNLCQFRKLGKIGVPLNK